MTSRRYAPHKEQDIEAPRQHKDNKEDNPTNSSVPNPHMARGQNKRLKGPTDEHTQMSRARNSEAFVSKFWTRARAYATLTK